MTGETPEGVHAELYVRSLAPRGAADEQATVVETLDKLSDRTTLADYQVHVCGEHLPATPAETQTTFGQYLLNRIAVFTEWAQRNDCSFGKLFERRTVDSALTGATRDVITLPMMTLAEYDGTDLRFVSPCSVDGETVSVRDRLDELLAGSDVETTPLADARVDSPDTTIRLTHGVDLSDRPASQ